MAASISIALAVFRLSTTSSATASGSTPSFTRRKAKYFDELAPSHCLPRGSGPAIVPTKTSILEGAHVRFGSKADMCSARAHVRFTPESDIKCDIVECPLWAIADSRPIGLRGRDQSQQRSRHIQAAIDSPVIARRRIPEIPRLCCLAWAVRNCAASIASSKSLHLQLSTPTRRSRS